MDTTRLPPAPYFEPPELRAELRALFNGHGSAAEARPAVVERLKGLGRIARATARQPLEIDGNGRRCATGLARFQDELVRLLFDYTVGHIYRATNPSDAERMAVVATGGYGRGALAPGSDIDLLFLLPYKQTPWGEQVVEYILYMLWDAGLKVGHATRNLDESIRLSLADMTIRTSILEARYICGNEDLFAGLEKRFDEEVVRGTGPQFIEAKLAERDARNRKAGATRYLVEPNVKEGKGGQRDLHTLFWITKYYYRVRTSDELVKL